MSAPPSLRRLLPAMVAASGAVSCGASIRALYESDVRFEHCMALDAVADVKPTIRRACWEEWVSFYTFGQTRDRIDYARQRKQELGAASDFDEGDEARRRALASASPYPTNASAPPPSTLATPDGGAALASTAATDDVSKGREACASVCERGRENCLTVCKKTPPCEQACAAREKRCVARCDVRPQGSR